MKFGKATLLAAACLGLLGMATGARADSIDPLTDLQNTKLLAPASYEYTVGMELTENEYVETGDYFILGYSGYSAGTPPASNLNYMGALSTVAGGTPAGWTATVNANDTITFMYSGPNLTDSSGNLNLGSFSFKSNIDLSLLPTITDSDGDSGQVLGTAKYQKTLLSGQSTNSIQLEVESPVGASVPLPDAAWMGVSSLAGIGLLALMRKRRVISGAF